MLRFLLAVPALALLACTGASRGTDSPVQPRVDAATVSYANWTTYHGDVQRTGYARTMPAASGTPRVVRSYRLDGPVYASPLVIGGKIVAATENDTVYALRGGKVLWKRHVGTPAPRSQLPCGNIFPLGITGTPAYANGLVYVVAELAGPPHHELYAIRLSNGTVAWKQSVDLSGVQTVAMQERGALVIAGGRVWVPFGGLAGDCGNYKGRIIRYALNGSGSAAVYTVPTSREAGIWTPPGPVYDGRYVYAAVGNGAAGGGDRYDHSDSILKFTKGLSLVDYFAPKNWASENDGDLDLGSQGPTVVGPWLFSAGKSGTAYVLRRSALGHIGGQVSSRSLCRSFGGTAVVGSTVYVPCTDGVRAVTIDSSGRMHVKWHAASNITGSPVVGGNRVWALDPAGGRLYALDPATGKARSSIAVGAASRFATPALYGYHVLVGTLRGLAVVGYT
jgi:hypothetical protein